jgi:hypothetical protein
MAKEKYLDWKPDPRVIVKFGPISLINQLVEELRKAYGDVSGDEWESVMLNSCDQMALAIHERFFRAYVATKKLEG